MRDQFYRKLISFTALENISEISNPLKIMGVEAFTHDITFGDGKVSMLGNNQTILDYYVRNEYPLVCTDGGGRQIEAGVYLDEVLIDKKPECKDLLSDVSYKFNIKNFLFICEKEEDCQHLYTFTTSLNKYDFLHLITNNLPKIFQFLEYYKVRAKPIISLAKKPQHQIILPYSNDSKFTYKKICPLNLRNNNTGKNYQLSFQQSRCLELALKGHSSKIIAAKLNLSCRTVEHYIENIRKQFGARSTKELIACVMSEYQIEYN